MGGGARKKKTKNKKGKRKKELFLFEPGNSSFTTTRAVAVAVLSKVRKPVSSIAFHSFRQAAHCVQPMATRPRAALSSIVCARAQGGGARKNRTKNKKGKRNKGL